MLGGSSHYSTGCWLECGVVVCSSGQKRDLARPRLVERGGAVLSGIGSGHHMPGRWVKVPGPLKKVRAGASDCRHQKETSMRFLQMLSSSQQVTEHLGKQRPMGGHGACVQEN